MSFQIRTATRMGTTMSLSSQTSFKKKFALDGENSVEGCFPQINRLAPASQDFHSGGNCFFHLFWHLNMPVRASHLLIDGETVL